MVRVRAGSRALSRRVGAGCAVAVLLLPAACARADDDAATRLTGTRVEVLGAWSGAEQHRFTEVLHRFAERTGATVRYTSAGDAGVPAVLADRLAAGHPPDVALLPQPGVLRRLAAAGRLVRPSAAVVAAVRRNYSPGWQRLGSADGHLYGVWFKAAEKSLIWYDVAAFEREGVVPPSDLPGLLGVAHALTRSGVPAFCVSAGEAWTLTDWFEDLYLTLAGPRRYDRLASHRLRWTDPSVVATLQEMARLLAPGNLAGGVAGARRTDFEESVELAFGPRRAAAMVHEGDFVAGVISSRTGALPGVDVDVFAFPPRDASSASTVVGGGDVAVALTRSAAADALLGYLASPVAASIWAAHGGFVSPNLNLDLSAYPGPISRRVARDLLDAGAGFRFDLSDLQPAAFGGGEDAGMQRELTDFLQHPDAMRTAARLEAAAVAAHAGASP